MTKVKVRIIGVGHMGHLGWFEKVIFPRFDFRLVLHSNADYVSSDEFVPRNLYIHAMKEGTKNLLRRVAGKNPTFILTLIIMNLTIKN